LDEKHHGAYSPEQLKVWAHSISNGSTHRTIQLLVRDIFWEESWYQSREGFKWILTCQTMQLKITICCAAKRSTHTLWKWHPQQAGVWRSKRKNNGTERTV